MPGREGTALSKSDCKSSLGSLVQCGQVGGHMRSIPQWHQPFPRAICAHGHASIRQRRPNGHAGCFRYIQITWETSEPNAMATRRRHAAKYGGLRRASSIILGRNSWDQQIGGAFAMKITDVSVLPITMI